MRFRRLRGNAGVFLSSILIALNLLQAVNAGSLIFLILFCEKVTFNLQQRQPMLRNRNQREVVYNLQQLELSRNSLLQLRTSREFEGLLVVMNGLLNLTGMHFDLA